MHHHHSQFGSTFSRQEFLDWYPGWMDIARAEIGTKETKGEKATPRVQEYQQFNVALFEKIKEGGWYNGDETPWCSAFVNWVFTTYGYTRTIHWAAKSWLNWGKACDPTYGAVVVLERPPNPEDGHVAFLIEKKGGEVILLGGNQSNSVCEQSYPASRVLSYRWPLEKIWDQRTREHLKQQGV